MFELRRAAAADSSSIRALIHQVGINPLSLDWRRFWLAVDEHDRLLGCGQVKPHSGGLRELASIAVRPEARGQGIARVVILRLLEENPPPLYLTCREELGGFYAPFGFRVLKPEEMPPYFRRLSGFVAVLRRLSPRAGQMLVMRRD